MLHFKCFCMCRKSELKYSLIFVYCCQALQRLDTIKGKHNAAVRNIDSLIQKDVHIISRGFCVLPGVDGHSTGYGVPDAGARARVSRLHDDEGPLLQGNHSEVLGVVQRLQEGAVTRPGMVTQTQVAILPPANLDWNKHTSTDAQVFSSWATVAQTDDHIF